MVQALIEEYVASCGQPSEVVLPDDRWELIARALRAGMTTDEIRKVFAKSVTPAKWELEDRARWETVKQSLEESISLRQGMKQVEWTRSKNTAGDLISRISGARSNWQR
jgi:hypothetical protein